MSCLHPDERQIEDLQRRVRELEGNQLSPEARLKLDILDTLPFTVWASTRDFKIVFWSGACERIYGFTSAEAIGQDYVDLFVDPLEGDQSREDCIKIVDEGRAFRNFLAYDRTKEGAARTMLTNCFRVYDHVRKEFLQVEVAVDVSDLELRKDEHRTLREFAKKRREDKEKLFGALRLQLIQRVSGEFTRRMMSLNAAEESVKEYEQTLLTRGSSQEQARKATAPRRDEIARSQSTLQTWNTQCIERATRAATLEDLEQLRNDLDAQLSATPSP